MSVTIEDISAARERLRDSDVTTVTRIDGSQALEDRLEATVRLKMEHLQQTGSFKPRGAYNKLARLRESDTMVDRVIAASAGNHAQGVALAASKTGFDSTVVMPKNAPQAKIEATRSYGADVVLKGQDFQTAMSHAKSLLSETATFVHAYDDPDVIAGQGTIGLEILEQVPTADVVVVPIGGGGLIGGISTALAARDPSIRVVGVQAAGAATVAESLQKGGPASTDTVRTIADGIATGGISERTYELIEANVDEVVSVSDTEIANAIVFLLERTKQMIEGAGAVPIAALLSEKIDVRGETVVPILSGGNLSMTDLQEVLDHALRYRDQVVTIQVRIVDEPGRMSDISSIIATHEANIRSINHERAVADLDVGEAYLNFRIETSGCEQTERIVNAIEDEEYNVRVLD